MAPGQAGLVPLLGPPLLLALASSTSLVVATVQQSGGDGSANGDVLAIHAGAEIGGIEFDGIGGLSGGGGCSRLLKDYPAEQQAQVLDILFQPEFGANLQILKVEIGGDAQSTDGTEPSHMHTESELHSPNFNRGYESWLMVEAKKRNPEIRLYALPWAWPGWLRNATGGANPLLDNTAVAAEYVSSWVRGMKTTHGLTIDFVSIWNEMDADLEAGSRVYIKALRKALDTKGCGSTKIVACDGHSFHDITKLFVGDPDLVADVDVLGAHYPGTHGPGAAGLGKKAWSSEDYSQVSNGAGPACWARVINRNFVTGNLTATIAWNLVDSYYDGLPFGRKGLMTAFNPWSGHYDVDDPIWSTAHTTQFTKAGWVYSPVGAGSGWLPQGGSYVTLVPGTAARSSHVAPTMTMVIEKMDPAKSKCEWEGVGNSTTPQNETVTFALHGDLAAITSLHVWRSYLGGGGGGGSNSGSGRPGVFEKLDPVAVASGRFSIELCAECVFTVTTLSTGQKGSFGKLANVTGWSAATSTAGFSDDFESYNISSEAAYWSDMAGSWEIVDATAFSTAQVAAADDTVHSGRGGHSAGGTTFGSKGKVMRQMVPSPPIFGIRTEVRPLSMIGEKNWGDTNLTIDAMVEEQGSGVYIGVNYLGLTSGPGYFLAVQGSRWSTALNVATVGSNGSSTQSGVLPAALALLPGSWRRLSLSVSSGKAAASIDGHTLFTDVPVKSTQTGFGVMGTVDYTVAQFDNVFVKAAYRGPSPAPAPGPGPAPAPAPGPSPGPSPPNPSTPVKCKAPAAGQSVRLWTCDPSRDEWQGWNVTSGQPISMLHAPNLCLGVGHDKLVQLMPCATAPSFIVASASSTVTTNSVHLKTQKGNECMDVAPHPDPHFGGSCPVDIWGCNNRFDGGANQLFELAGAHTSNPIGAIVSALWGKDLCVSVCA